MSACQTDTHEPTTSTRATGLPPGAVILVVIVLTVVAGLLRLHRLGDWSFWVDELFTIRDSVGTGWRFHGGTYPLSYILIAQVIGHFGVNEWNARLIPAIFGILTPALIYLLGRKTFGEWPSLIAAGLVAVSPWHLYWSQMARFYTMTLFFSAASLIALHRGLEEDRKWLIGGAGVLLALGALSHYSALLLMPGIILYFLLLRFLKWTKPRGLTLTNVLIFLSPFILGAIAVGVKAGSLLSQYIGGSSPTGTTISNPIKGAVYVITSLGYRLELTVAVLALVAVGIGISRRDRGALFLGSVTAVAACLLAVFGSMSHAENRYAFVILAPTVLLAGSAVAAISSRLWSSSRVLALMVPLLVALPMIQHDAFYFRQASDGERWDYRAASDYVKGHAKPSDIVYSSMSLPVEYYLRGSRLSVLDMNKLAPPAVPSARIWFVTEDSTRGESAPKRLNGWMRDHCRLEAHFSAGSPAADYGISVYSFDNRRHPAHKIH